MSDMTLRPALNLACQLRAADGSTRLTKTDVCADRAHARDTTARPDLRAATPTPVAATPGPGQSVPTTTDRRNESTTG